MSGLPSVDELLDGAIGFALPLRDRFRGTTVRQGLLLRGPVQWAEFAPFPEYDADECARWLSSAIESGWVGWPEPLRETVAVNAIVPAVSPARAAELVEASGCTTAKVKVAEPGQTLDDDVARVAAVRDVLGPSGRLRIDANGVWSTEDAVRALDALQRFDLEYVEQPCATVDELAQVRRRVKYMGIPIAADESVRKAEDPLAVARAGAADILVIKAQPLGGISAALALLAEAGLPVVVSSALDTSVGISMGLHLAAAIPELEFDCGLATAALLAADVTDAPLTPRDGELPVRRVVPTAELLARHAATQDRTLWWRARLERCHALLADQAG